MVHISFFFSSLYSLRILFNDRQMWSANFTSYSLDFGRKNVNNENLVGNYALARSQRPK